MRRTIYTQGQELPDLALILRDDEGNIVELADYDSAEVRVGRLATDPATLVKTTGIVLADTAPNFRVEWNPGELNIPIADDYTLVAIATKDGRDRIWKIPFGITATVGATT